MALGPLDTIGHPLWDANQDLQDSTNSNRHASLQGLQDSAAVPTWLAESAGHAYALSGLSGLSASLHR